MNRPIRETRIPILAASLLAAAAHAAPVMFVTATPSTGDTVSGTFRHFVSFVGNHEGTSTKSPRGGDLYIRYDNGTLRNLTAECGYGTTPGQEICVREANVHWNGQKAVFSMAVGGTGSNPPTTYFQMYEITGILEGQTAQIAKLPQPENYNNVQPVYATDGSIIFATDMPATQNPDHYPQLDEYESTPVVSGLWRTDIDGTDLRILDHCPSGDFTPIVDSFGRVVFTRWDHLKRDQQVDLWIDEQLLPGADSRAKPFTFDTEDGDTHHVFQYGDEYFPENGRLHPDVDGPHNPGKVPHAYWDQDYVVGMEKQDFNFFFPWMINEDGTDAEVLNHLGRHEFFGFVERSLTTLPDFFRSGSVFVRSFNQIRESPVVPGRFYGVDAAEFGTHGAGRIICFDAPPSLNPDAIPATMADITPPTDAAWAGNAKTNMFRDPMVRQDGTIWASCTGTGDFADNTAVDPGAPNPYPLSSNYQFKIRQLVDNGEGYLEPGPALCPDIVKSVSYTTPYFWPIRTVAYNGPMWELFPVEVVPRTPPTPTTESLHAPEHNVLLAELGSEQAIEDLRAWMRDQKLALVVSRDVTARADDQQPYNLKVAGSGHQNTEVGETPEEVAWLQFFAARYVRAYAGNNTGTVPQPGRRPIARFVEEMPGHDEPTAPFGAARIGDDGSTAAFVPAERALTWQLAAEDGTPVVRERYWLTFKAGEIRTCTNCHGTNTTDVHGNPPPSNESAALADLLGWWKAEVGAADVKDWSRYDSIVDP